MDKEQRKQVHDGTFAEHSNDSQGTSEVLDEEAATSKIKDVDLSSDNRAIKWSRLSVFFVLACAAAALGCLTYYYVQKEQIGDFETEVSKWSLAS